MRTRKLFLYFSAVISSILFVTGIIFFAYINTDSPQGNSSGSFIADYVAPFKSGPINILVMGGDDVAGNTDTMMLVNINPQSSKISILSIPRDTQVEINGRTQKINAAYDLGRGKADVAINAVSNLLNVNINYYVYINLKGFRDVIDLLGGVDFYVPVALNYDDPVENLHIHLQKGYQHLDGAHAEQFMRFRHPNRGGYTHELMQYYNGSDTNRVKAQQDFIKEVIKQKLNLAYLPKLKAVLDSIFKNIKTNISTNLVLQNARILDKFNSSNLKIFTISGSDEMQNGLSYYIFNQKIIEGNTNSSYPASEIIEQYFQAKGTYTGGTSINRSSSSSGIRNRSTVRPSSIIHKSTPKPSVTKDNPSNNDTSITGSGDNETSVE